MFLKLKGLVSFLLAIIVLGSFAVSAEQKSALSTEHYSEDLLCNISLPANSNTVLDIKAKSVILMEPKTGTVLYEADADQKLPPASITKIMSLLLVMEAIENESITLSTEVVTSEHAASMGGSQIWLEVGEIMTVDEMLHASVIASANDATVALAELVAGSEESFVLKMNEKAKELGMTNTHFVNACGLDAEGHLTTARDVAIMSSALIKHDLIKKYSTVWMDALRDGKSELVNTNKLVRYYNGATGLKTGTTSGAGCCVSATAERDGMELVAVVMNGENSNERFSGAKKLLDFGFANWEFMKVTADLTGMGELECKKGMTKKVIPEAIKSLQLLIEKGNKGKVETKILPYQELTAPINKGDKIGVAEIYLAGEKVGTIDITAANEVQKLSFFGLLIKLMQAALVP